MQPVSYTHIESHFEIEHTEDLTIDERDIKYHIEVENSLGSINSIEIQNQSYGKVDHGQHTPPREKLFPNGYVGIKVKVQFLLVGACIAVLTRLSV